MTDPFEFARAEEMIFGYSARWFDEPLEVLAVEAEFEGPLTNPETGAASKTFALGGKLDAIVRRGDRVLVVEHKTSSEDISPGSFYWRRLTLNAQISTYMVGARALGFEPAGILYDVLGKPAQRPSQVPIVDEDGVKIGVDRTGRRVRTINGKKWRETASTADGFVLQTRPETVAEYRARVREAICAAPDAYFVRGDVVRLLEEERDAAFDAWQTAAAIREGRRLDRFPRNPDACIRYGSTCSYFDVCAGQGSLEDGTRFRRVDNVHEELAPKATRLPLLTNSELSAYRACTRLHHYRYDLGVRALEDAENARFGTLVHRGLEGWWLGRKAGLNERGCIDVALERMLAAPPPVTSTAAPSRMEIAL